MQISFRILISESPLQVSGGAEISWKDRIAQRSMNRYIELNRPRYQLINTLHKMLRHPDKHELATEQIQLIQQVTRNPALPVRERNRGPLMQGLALDKASPALQDSADQSMIVVSPLFGLLAAGDLVPEIPLSDFMPLPGNAETPFHYWLPERRKLLEQELKDMIVYNLLPEAYDLLLEDLPCKQIYRFNFPTEAVDRDLVQGELARFILENHVQAVGPFREFHSSSQLKLNLKTSHYDGPRIKLDFEASAGS